MTLIRQHADQDDANAVDHLLTCPRCAELCPADCRYCAECGSRLLTDEAYPRVDDPILDAPYEDALESPSDADRP